MPTIPPVRAALRVAAMAGTLVVGGCELLDTDQPNIIQPGQIDNSVGAEARRVGALHDFTFVKDGDGNDNLARTEGLVILTGDMSDEFMHSGFIPSTVEFDQRLIADANGSLSTIFFRLQRARVASEEAAASLQQFATDPSTNAGIPEMLSLTGYTYVYFGENFCSGVTYSDTQNGLVVPGIQDSTVGTFTHAIDRFDSALTHPAAGVDPTIQYLAQVGKARALLDLGQFGQAAAAVAGVPTDFQYVTEHDATPQELINPIFFYGVADATISMADAEGGNGIPYRALLDPRVPYDSTGDLGLDQTTPQFNILKYPDEGAPIVVANGIEARLIEAEERLQANDIPGMLAKLQAVRDTMLPSLPTLGTPAGQADAVDTLFQERALWMYATGHRLSDLRRLVRQYGRNVNAVFPTGSYLRGGSYGTQVNFPVPQDEEDQNPNFSRTKCDPTQP